MCGARACVPNGGCYLFGYVADEDVVVTSRPPADVVRYHPRGACSWRGQVLGRVLEAGGPDTWGQTDVKRSVPEGARGGREGRCKQRSRRGCAGDSVGMMLAVLCQGRGAGGELEDGAGAGGLWLRRALGARSPSRCWSALVRSFSGARPRARRSRRTRRTSSTLRDAAHPDLVEDDDGQGGHFFPLMMMVFHEIRHKSDHDGHREWGGTGRHDEPRRHVQS